MSIGILFSYSYISWIDANLPLIKLLISLNPEPTDAVNQTADHIVFY